MRRPKTGPRGTGLRLVHVVLRLVWYWHWQTTVNTAWLTMTTFVHWSLTVKSNWSRDGKSIFLPSFLIAVANVSTSRRAYTYYVMNANIRRN